VHSYSTGVFCCIHFIIFCWSNVFVVSLFIRVTTSSIQWHIREEEDIHCEDVVLIHLTCFHSYIQHHFVFILMIPLISDGKCPFPNCPILGLSRKLVFSWNHFHYEILGYLCWCRYILRSSSIHSSVRYSSSARVVVTRVQCSWCSCYLRTRLFNFLSCSFIPDRRETRDKLAFVCCRRAAVTRQFILPCSVMLR